MNDKNDKEVNDDMPSSRAGTTREELTAEKAVTQPNAPSPSQENNIASVNEEQHQEKHQQESANTSIHNDDDMHSESSSEQENDKTQTTDQQEIRDEENTMRADEALGFSAATGAGSLPIQSSGEETLANQSNPQSRARTREYDERVASRKRKLLERATLDYSNMQHHDTQQEENILEDTQDENTTTAPGDELARGILEPLQTPRVESESQSETIFEATVVYPTSGDDISGDINNDETPSEQQQPTTMATSSTCYGARVARKHRNNSSEVINNENARNEKVTDADLIATPRINNDENNDGSAEQSTPGAYAIRGRAMGAYPSWGRHANTGINAQLEIMDSDQPANNVNGTPHGPDAVLSSTEISAVMVDEEELHHQVRNEILRESVQAEVLEEGDIEKTRRFMRFTLVGGGILCFLIIVAVSVGLSVGLTKSESESGENRNRTTSPTFAPTSSPTQTPRPTLETVLDEGILKCGMFAVNGLFGNDTGVYIGFEWDLCRALAAAVFGDANRVEPIILTNRERFNALSNRLVHVLVRSTTHTMDRDVYQADAETGFAFSVPYLYDGLGFAGIPPFGLCANKLDPYFDKCRLLRVCVSEASTHLDLIQTLLPQSSFVASNNILDDFVKSGICNAVAGEKFQIARESVHERGYTGDYEIGDRLFSKEPIACVTRKDDTEWSDFVNWVLKALLAAEELSITRETALMFPVFLGGQYVEMFRNAIAAVGNYGELYNRHLEAIVPRQDIDRINFNGSSGLLYSHPFGAVNTIGPEPVRGRTLKKIVDRGYLLCGITARPGLGVFDADTQRWSGMDADFCNATSWGIFGPSVGTVTFVELPTDGEERFTALAVGEVDVLSGSAVNIETDILSSIGKGFSFSQPYFYNPPSGGAENSSSRREAIALATRHDDSQFSDFVYWIAASTFYAEEQFIGQASFDRMPLVNLFGSPFQAMFQNAIFAIGNYNETYYRNMQSIIPRSGRNTLNVNSGPQHYPPQFDLL